MPAAIAEEGDDREAGDRQQAERIGIHGPEARASIK